MPALVAEEPRAVYDVRTAVENRRQKRRVLVRVVLEVGVLDDDDVARGGTKTARHCRALALIERLQQHAHAARAVHRGENVARAVLRAVVDDQDLAIEAAEVDSLHPSHDLLNRRALVVAGNDDRQRHGSAHSMGPANGPAINTGAALVIVMRPSGAGIAYAAGGGSQRAKRISV